MSNIRGYCYAIYQNDNLEKFNEDLIYNKDNENILKFADAIGKVLEIIPSIDYLGSHKEPIRKIYKSTEVAKKIDIEKSVFDEIVLEFRIHRETDGEEEEKNVSLRFYFPRLIDHQFFIINGITYKPIYQLLDSGTYRTRKYLILKNLIMPIQLGHEDRNTAVKLTDLDGNTYEENIYSLNLFKHVVNPFLYFYAKMGFVETIDYFGLTDYIMLINLDEGEEYCEDAINFKLSNALGISVDPEFIEESLEQKMIVFTFIATIASRMNMSKIMTEDTWIKKLGSIFTKNNSVYYEKGINILLSYQRTLDNITKMVLRIPEEDKEDTFAITRWMMRNYFSLSKLDNMDLANKRLRLYEPLVYPLQRRLSKGVYRLLNKKNPTLSEIESIFKIPKGFLISSIVKNEIIQYVNSVNSYDLFSIALKGTSGGPQSPFSGKTDNMRQRALHPSYIQRRDLVSTSAGDPGVSFVLVPFLHLEKDMHFTEKFELNPDEEIEEKIIDTIGMDTSSSDDQFEMEDD